MTVLREEWECDLPNDEVEGLAVDAVLSLSLGALPTASPLLEEEAEGAVEDLCITF